MTTFNREEIIRAIAVSIHEGNCCASWEQALKSAEAALDALIGILPHTCHLTQRILGLRVAILHDEEVVNLYEQLLSLKRE